MAQVIRPQRQGGGLGEVLAPVGAVAGAVYGGGPGGAVAGYSAGQMAGGMLDPQKPQEQPVGQQSQAEAMRRKQEQMSTDNLAVLKRAEAQLPQLPEAMRQQYAPAIIQARMAEQQRRG